MWGAALAAHAAPDGKAARFYEDALTRYEQRDVKGAILQLKNALQIDRSLLPVHVLLGKTLLANGEAAAAEVAFTEASRLGVNRAEVVVPMAQAAIAQGKQQQVLEQPRFALAGLPAGVQVQLLLLRSASASDIGLAPEALRALDEARAIDARSADVWLAEVPIRIRTRQFAEAAAAADKALALEPGSADAWYQKGSVMHVQGKRADALAAYERALRIDATHLEARVSRAGLLIDGGNTAEAAKDVAELRRLSPREPRGAYLRALLAEREGNTAAASAALREVTELIDPVPIEFIRYRPQLLMLGGLAHFGLNEREKAKPFLELFQRVNGSSGVSKLLAHIHLGESNVDRAIEALEGYLRVQPADSQALALLASCYMSQGRHAKAAALMQEALRTRDTPELRAVLGLSLIGSGQPGNATAELEAAWQRDAGQMQAGAALVGIYLQGGDSAKALAVANTLVKQQPSNAGFFNLLGMAKARAGDAAGAKAAFETSARLDAAFASPKLQLARLETSAGAFDAAAARLAALLKTDERNVDALMEMASLSERRKQPAEAQRWLEKAAAQSAPRDLRPGMALVDLHLRAGRHAAALVAARGLSAKAPEDLAVLLAMARAQLATGDTKAARATLGTATRIANYSAPVQVEIAGLQQWAGNLPGAVYSLQKALTDRPDFLPAQALLADVELRQGEPAKAEQRARQIVQKHPRLAIGHSLLGDVAAARNQPAAAIEAYRRAHQVEPSTDTLLRLFGRLATQPDGVKTAPPLADQWLKTHPRDRAVRRALADHHARNANYAAARTAYEALLALAPNDGPALNNLANVLLRTGDPKALETAERALAQNPTEADYIDTVGWAAYRSGQLDRALQLLRDARLRKPDSPDIRFHLATVLAQVGRRNEAREEIELALRGGREWGDAAEAEVLLRGLR
jgi:putative PEP-CTERM system TPR-repeat lipoprotein